MPEAISSKKVFQAAVFKSLAFEVIAFTGYGTGTPPAEPPPVYGTGPGSLVSLKSLVSGTSQPTHG